MSELRFAPDAFSDIPKSETERLLIKITWLWDNRKTILHHPLRYELSGLYKYRVSKYRIIYDYDENPDNMTIRLVGTRDTIYKDAIRKLS